MFSSSQKTVFCEALLRVLVKKGDIRVVGAHPYSAAVHDDIVSKMPGIVVMDSGRLATSNAGLIAALQTSIPGVRIVMVDMEADEETFLQAVREGVMGYVLNNASAAEVAATIRSVAAGIGLSSIFVGCFFRYASQPSTSAPVCLGLELGLSRKEQQLDRWLREHLTNKQHCRSIESLPANRKPSRPGHVPLTRT